MRSLRVWGNVIPSVDQWFHIEQQGHLLKVSLRGNEKAKPPPGASTRGDVTTFSRKSRKRLLDLFARLKWDGRKVTFVTLTFGGTPTHAAAREAFRRFAERLRRKHPNVSYVWRKELQERGSIHYHFIAFDMPYYPQASLQRVWEQCTGEDQSIVDIRLVKSRSQMTAYVAKYVAKVADSEAVPSLETPPYPHATPPESTGRWWGIHNRDYLPFDILRSFSCRDDEAVRHLRWFVDCASAGRASKYVNGTTLYSEEASAAYHWIYGQHWHYIPPPSFVRAKWNGLKHGVWHRVSTCNVYPTPPDAVGESGYGSRPSKVDTQIWGTWDGESERNTVAAWLACQRRGHVVR